MNDRILQKAKNCDALAGQQVATVLDVLTHPEKPFYSNNEPPVAMNDEQRRVACIGLLTSAKENLLRAHNFFTGKDPTDREFVNSLERELDDRAAPAPPATWGDVVNFALGLSLPRLKKAWNVAMIVLTEEA